MFWVVITAAPFDSLASFRESRVLKNVMQDPKPKQSDLKEEEDLKEEKEEVEEKEEQHRSFSRTGNDLIETDY